MVKKHSTDRNIHSRTFDLVAQRTLLEPLFLRTILRDWCIFIYSVVWAFRLCFSNVNSDLLGHFLTLRSICPSQPESGVYCMTALFKFSVNQTQHKHYLFIF